MLIPDNSYALYFYPKINTTSYTCKIQYKLGEKWIHICSYLVTLEAQREINFQKIFGEALPLEIYRKMVTAFTDHTNIQNSLPIIIEDVKSK